jgi:hypothetical protein
MVPLAEDGVLPFVTKALKSKGAPEPQGRPGWSSSIGDSRVTRVVNRKSTDPSELRVNKSVCAAGECVERSEEMLAGLGGVSIQCGIVSNR